MDGVLELCEDGRLGGRDVVRAQDQFNFGSEYGKLFHGGEECGEIRFGAVEPDFPGIEGVSGEEQTVGAVDERDGVGRVAGRRDDFYGAAAEIYFEAVVDEERNFPGLGGIFCGIEIFGQRAAQLVFGDFGLRVCAGAFSARASEGGVHPVDERELPVAADVIVVGVGIEYHDGARSEARDDGFDVADAHAGVEEQRLLRAYDEKGDDFFALMRFVNRERGWRYFVNFKPRVVERDLFERFVFRAREIFAPFGFFGLLRREERKI